MADEQDSSDGFEDGPTTEAGTTTTIKIAQAALRHLFERMRSTAITGLTLVEALPSLGDEALRTCLMDVETHCRDVGNIGHETARAVHDLLIERRRKRP